MMHGFAGVKEWVAPYAEVFSAARLAYLVYDHPGFGTSDGEPRFEVDPAAQIVGYRDGITFAQTLTYLTIYSVDSSYSPVASDSNLIRSRLEHL